MLTLPSAVSATHAKRQNRRVAMKEVTMEDRHLEAIIHHQEEAQCMVVVVAAAEADMGENVIDHIELIDMIFGIYLLSNYSLFYYH
jgi:hypothetical protein